MTLFCVYLMATFGLNLTVGYAGQMSLGQAAFFGIGAYIAAILMTKLGMSFWLVLPIAAIACFVGRPGAGLSGAARAAPLPRVRHARLQRAGVPGDAQRGEAHRRHVRHLRHPAAVAVRLFARRRAAPSSTSRFVSVIMLAAGAVVAAALAVGTRVRGAARQPDPRREPRRQHHRVHAARVRDRRGLRRHRRRLSARRWSSSSSRASSTCRCR